MKQFTVKFESVDFDINISLSSIKELTDLKMSNAAHALLLSGGYSAGLVTDKTKTESIAMYADNEAVAELCRNTLVGPSINILKDFDDLMSMEDSIAVFWHEVGHLALGHLNNPESINEEHLLEINGYKVVNNEQIEIEADAFAASRVGYHRLLSGITNAIRIMAKLSNDGRIADGLPADSDYAARMLESFRNSNRYQEFLKYTEGY